MLLALWNIYKKFKYQEKRALLRRNMLGFKYQGPTFRWVLCSVKVHRKKGHRTKSPLSCIDKPPIEGLQNSWDNRVLKRHSESYAAWYVRQGRAVGALTAAITYPKRLLVFVRPVHGVWRCLSAFQKSFCGISEPSMQLESTGKPERPSKSRNNDIRSVNLLHLPDYLE